MDKTMATTRELKGFIKTSIKELSVEKLDLFLSLTPNVSESFNSTTLSNLYKLLMKDAKHEVKLVHVSCMLSCLEHFLECEIDLSVWEKLADKVNMLCLHGFLISTKIRDESITTRSLNIAIHILDYAQILANTMIRTMLESLLKTVTEDLFSISCQQLLLILIGTLLQKSSRETRQEILPSVRDHLTKLSNSLPLCGDYETQTNLVEILARSWNYIKEDHPQAFFSTCPFILEYFNSYSFLKFDTECRLFLNQVNCSLDDQQLVYSAPCLVAHADGVVLKRPLDPMWKEFWVDFNTSTRRITFYYMSTEDNWELMNMEERDFVYIFAQNSHCKSKEGEVISAVKMEITLNVDPSKPKLPKVLKIYPRKTREFAELEKKFISKIFKEKYKSEVTYTDLPLKESGSRPPTPHPKFAKTDKIKNTSNYNRLEISISQNKSFTPVSNLDVTCDTVTRDETTVVAAQQVVEESHTESDLIGPSPTSESRTIEKNRIPECKKTQHGVNDSNKISKCSDAFAHFVKSFEKGTSGDLNDSMLKGNASSRLNLTAISHNSRKNQINKTYDTCAKGEHSNFDGGDKEIEERLGPITPTNKTNSKDVLKKSEKKLLTPVQNILPIRGQQSISNLGPALTCINQNKKQDTQQIDVASFQCKNIKRKHLYSVENSNSKELVMSSQEDFSLEPPSYKLKKPESVVVRQPAANTNNITFSYLKFHKNQNTSATVHSDNSFTDTNEVKHNKSNERMESTIKPLLKEPSSHSKCLTLHSDKKLLEQNKTPESTSKSGLLPMKPVGSDLFTPEKKIVVKKTYARKTLKKGRKRIEVNLSSDSDSDNVPSSKVTLKTGNDRIFTDINEVNKSQSVDKKMESRVMPLLKEPSSHSKCLTSHNDRKLLEQYKSPERTKKSGLCYMKSVYSDFSSPETNMVVKKKYARKIPKKGMKRIKVIQSSDSDSDYVPSKKVNLKTEAPLCRSRGKSNKESYVTNLRKTRVDPIRDVVRADEMEIEPMLFEEPVISPVELHVLGSSLDKPKPTSKKQSKPNNNQGKVGNKKVPSKKDTDKVKKGGIGQLKKQFAQKNIQSEKNINEDFASEVPPVLDLVRYIPSDANEILGMEETALKILSCRRTSQESEESQSLSNISDMIKFGMCCTLNVRSEIERVRELSNKERQTKMEAFDFKVQSSLRSIQFQSQELETVGKNLAEIKSLLENTYDLQKRISSKIKTEAALLEAAKQDAMDIVIDVQKSESFQITTEFRRMGQFIKRLVLSIIPNRAIQH